MKKEIITFKDPKSPISEVFRILRTNIQFMNTSKELSTLLITSTMPGEGKSWMSANLAVTFAQAGKRVVLVDADMRKGRQFNLFGVKPTPGLSNYLSGYTASGEVGETDVLKYIKETEVENLYLLPAGSIPPNPSELLINEKTINMMPRLKEYFDLIIFDGTPSAIVTDSVILSRFVDATIIVSAYKQTKIDVLKRVEKEIKNVGGNILGVVLNKLPISNKKYDSQYYYYGDDNDKKKIIAETSNLSAYTKSDTKIKVEEKIKVLSDATQKAKTEDSDIPALGSETTTIEKSIQTPNRINEPEEELTEEEKATGLLRELNKYVLEERMKSNKK